MYKSLFSPDTHSQHQTPEGHTLENATVLLAGMNEHISERIEQVRSHTGEQEFTFS